MGPGRKLPTLGHISFADLRDAYAVQARGLRFDFGGSTKTDPHVAGAPAALAAPVNVDL